MMCTEVVIGLEDQLPRTPLSASATRTTPEKQSSLSNSSSHSLGWSLENGRAIRLESPLSATRLASSELGWDIEATGRESVTQLPSGGELQLRCQVLGWQPYRRRLIPRLGLCYFVSWLSKPDIWQKSRKTLGASLLSRSGIDTYLLYGAVLRPGLVMNLMPRHSLIG